MSDWRESISAEHDAVLMRIVRLEDFARVPEFDALPEAERADLLEQLRGMRIYAAALGRRRVRNCEGD